MCPYYPAKTEGLARLTTAEVTESEMREEGVRSNNM